MKITPTSIAIGLAVIITFGLLIWKPLISNILPASSSTMSTSANDNVQTVPSEDLVKSATPENASTQISLTDTVVGTGVEAKAGDTVTVQYTGELTNGKVFDASRSHGDTGFTFQLGAGQVIKGWDQGVAGMKVGGTRVLVIPPNFGYGSQDVGNGLIPPNSTLIFEVELIKVGK